MYETRGAQEVWWHSMLAMAKNVSAQIHLQYCNALDLRCLDVLTPMYTEEETFQSKE